MLLRVLALDMPRRIGVISLNLLYTWQLRLSIISLWRALTKILKNWRFVIVALQGRGLRLTKIKSFY